MSLVTGENWWARVAERGNDSNQLFWRVIAWESNAPKAGDDGPGRLVAWINGREPVRSDLFNEQVDGWVLYDFVDKLPDGARVSSWA